MQIFITDTVEQGVECTGVTNDDYHNIPGTLRDDHNMPELLVNCDKSESLAPGRLEILNKSSEVDVSMEYG